MATGSNARRNRGESDEYNTTTSATVPSHAGWHKIPKRYTAMHVLELCLPLSCTLLLLTLQLLLLTLHSVAWSHLCYFEGNTFTQLKTRHNKKATVFGLGYFVCFQSDFSWFRTKDVAGQDLGAKPGEQQAPLQRSQQQDAAVALPTMESQH